MSTPAPTGPPAEEPPSRAAAAGTFVRRVGRSYRALEREQRSAVYAAVALFVTMFLPWYTNTGFGAAKAGEAPKRADVSVTAFGAFSFVEAAVLLVSLGVLWMLFARGEGKAFHLPFGDGNVIFGAGVWVCLLVFYRFFDKPDPQGGLTAATVGVTWGIFVTAGVGVALALAGQRLRGAHLVEPPLPGDVAPSDDPLPRGRRRPAAATAATEVVAPRPREQAAPGSSPATGRSAAAEARPRPAADAAPTTVDRRGPSIDDTVLDDVPEFPPRRGGPKRPTDG